ncbi:MAG: FAD-dependent oxidoreductase [Actinomycetota bacterium]|nr:FAD-dependent oxidoreductase [Actinomycetota bacterium]
MRSRGEDDVRDVLVVGGGFAGVTAAREAALAGQSVLLLEARDRLGGRTWSSSWDGIPVEYGGQWVHWHQPHTWSELTRAGLRVVVSGEPDVASWFVGDERRSGMPAERDAIAERGWNRFVEGVEEALPNPHEPLAALERLERFDRRTVADRLRELDLTREEEDVLAAELESVTHAPLDEAGAVSILRWHALSGYTLALTQFTGGRVTIDRGTGALLDAIATAAPVETRLETPVAAVAHADERVEVTTRSGEEVAARAAVVAVPLNVLGRIEFDPPLSETKRDAIALGQASRGVKIMIRAAGDERMYNAVKREHAFGYLDSQALLEDGSQLLIGFGPGKPACDAGDLAAVQRALDELLPGFEAVAAYAHDWAHDEFARGTWAIHRPGWYTNYHGEMQRPEGRIVLAGSDLANGWAGFIDGAIESGLRAGAAVRALLT